jgi:hypothetical protein
LDRLVASEASQFKSFEPNAADLPIALHDSSTDVDPSGKVANLYAPIATDAPDGPIPATENGLCTNAWKLE